MPAPGVGIELLDHGLILVVGVGEICPGTGAGHRRAEEDIDDEHEQEEDTEHDAEVEQPGGMRPSARAIGAEGVHVCS